MVENLRKRFGQRTILSVGRLVYYKGIEFLVRAMTKVDARLVIIGDGPLRDKLEREAASNGITDRIIFLGEVDDNLVNYYHASDVFALPSCERSEAFGIVQLEAMACGIPVVNTRIDTGVPYVSLDGVTGFTVAPRSSDEMAAALNRLLDNPDLRNGMGRAGRARVANEFGIAEMAAKTLDLYQSVLRDKGKLIRAVAPLRRRQHASACYRRRCGSSAAGPPHLARLTQPSSGGEFFLIDQVDRSRRIISSCVHCGVDTARDRFVSRSPALGSSRAAPTSEFQCVRFQRSGQQSHDNYLVSHGYRPIIDFGYPYGLLAILANMAWFRAFL